MCADESRVIKLFILDDNLTLICMCGRDKVFYEDIKIIDLETKDKKSLGCSNPFDFCCSSDSKMIFVADRESGCGGTVLKGFDLKS